MVICIHLGLSLQPLKNKIDACEKLIQYVFDQKKKNSWKIRYSLMIIKVYCEPELSKASTMCITNAPGVCYFFLSVLNFISLECAKY